MMNKQTDEQTQDPNEQFEIVQNIGNSANQMSWYY